ncbi:MAG TPA: hypothetical protein VIC51_05925 [Psychromonas sp.]
MSHYFALDASAVMLNSENKISSDSHLFLWSIVISMPFY